jgi:hypothetical protein
MSKLTTVQKEQLKRIILDSILQRLTALETQSYVKDKLGVEISIDHLRHVRMDLRQDSKKEIDHLRKDRFAYMNHLFFERAEELKAMQRKLWEIIKDNQEDNPDAVIRSIGELHKLSNSLSSMYEMLPVLGRLPSDSFAGFGLDNNNTGAAADKQEGVETESDDIPPSTLGSGGV